MCTFFYFDDPPKQSPCYIPAWVSISRISYECCWDITFKDHHNVHFFTGFWLHLYSVVMNSNWFMLLVLHIPQGDIYCIYYLHFSLWHSWALIAVLYNIYAPSLPFEVRCESGIPRYQPWQSRYIALRLKETTGLYISHIILTTGRYLITADSPDHTGLKHIVIQLVLYIRDLLSFDCGI